MLRFAPHEPIQPHHSHWRPCRDERGRVHRSSRRAGAEDRARSRLLRGAGGPRPHPSSSAQCALLSRPSRCRATRAPPLVGDDFLATGDCSRCPELVNKIQRTMPADKPGKPHAESRRPIWSRCISCRAVSFPSGSAELASSEAALKAITIAGPAAAKPATIAPGRRPPPVTFPAAGNMAQLMRGILFPSSNLIFNVQTHSPDEVKTTANAGVQSSGFSWLDWGPGFTRRGSWWTTWCSPSPIRRR